MNYLSENASRLTPYLAGLQPEEPGWIKLNTNENPYPPSPQVVEALRGVDLAALRLYPDNNSKDLIRAIAKTLDVREENIFPGNGSDDVLALAFAAFLRGKSDVRMPDITYAFYPVWSALFEVGVTTVPLRDDYTIAPTDYQGAQGVVLANPNAPTGLALGLADIEQILRQNPAGVVVVDEAYIDFASVESAVKLIDKYENLLVVRTFSKSHALAGLRVGYAVGHEGLIAGLQRVKNAYNSYPLDRMAQIGAAVSIADTAYWAGTRARVIQTREKTAGALGALGCRVLDSQTNFLLFHTERANELYEHLFKHKIMVRYWDKPRLSEWLRATIGTEAEMEAFIACVKQF